LLLSSRKFPFLVITAATHFFFTRVSVVPADFFASTFAFAPPAGAKKVKELDLEVFPQ